MAQLSDLTGLIDVIGDVKGRKQKTSTSGSQTTQTDLSDEAVNDLVQQILQGPGGVQSIGTSARRAGVYNSTAEDLLLSNLYSNAAVKAEQARAPTTTTTDQSQTIEMEGQGMGGLITTLGGSAILSPVVEAVSGKIGGAISGGVDDLVSGMFGGGAGATAGSTGGSLAGGVGATMGGGASGGLYGNVASGLAGSAGGAATSAASGLYGNAATGGLASGASSAAAGGVGGSIGSFAGTNAVPLAGGFLSGLASGKDAATEPAGLAMNAAMGALTMGPVGLVAAPVMAALGGLLSDEVSIICTALMNRGLLDRHLYAEGQEYLGRVNTATKIGYYHWATGVAAKIDQGSKFWTGLCLPLARGRTALLATQGSVLDHIRHPLGTLTKYVGEPACWVIGKFVMLRQFIAQEGK